MASFEEAIPVILEHEGGKSNRKNDRGGKTNFGITKKLLERIYYKNAQGEFILDPYELTIEDAKKIYELVFWNPCKLDQIINQEIATKILDMTVNMGQGNAMRLVQKACLRVVPNCGVKADGVIGKYTLNAINEAEPMKLLMVIRSECVAYYEAIVRNDSTQAENINGWIKRAYS